MNRPWLPLMKKTLILVSLLATLFACSNKGEPLPAFSLKTLDGDTITEKDLVGKTTVINVWATWCGNCLNELDDLNVLAAKYESDTNVVFLALSDEDPSKIKDFLMRRPFNFTHIPDGTVLTDAIQTRLVKTYPQHIVLDKDLKITYEATGELQDANAELSKEIDNLRSN